MTQLPIACSLGPDQGADRMARWQAVNRSLAGREHRAGVIEARYVGGASLRSELAALVAAERDCCGHLTWELDDAADVVTLRIRGSEDDLDAFEV